jgi:hypothetical protein
MKLILTFFILSLFISCSNEITKHDLIGKWGGFQGDTTYIEAWFTDSLLLDWNADIYSHRVYSYLFNIKNKQLIIMNSYDREKLNTIDINFINTDSIKLSDHKNSWTLYRIDSKTPNLSESRRDTIDFEIGIREKKTWR